MIRSRHRLALLLSAALALFSAACGQTEPTETDATDATTDSSGNATVTATVSPEIVTAGGSADPDYSWKGAFTVTLANTNDNPITIDSISADLQQTSGWIVINPLPDTDEAFRFEVAAPHNRIDTNSTMEIPFTFFYSLPARGRESIVNLTIAITTDEGLTGSVTATAKFQ